MAFSGVNQEGAQTAHAPWADPLLWIALALGVLSLAPSFIPVLSPEALFTWADQYSDVPPLLAALFLFLVASRVPSSRERSFWLLMAGSVVAILANRALYWLIPFEAWGTWLDLVHDNFYLVCYLLVAVALELRPDRNPAKGYQSSLQGIEMAGTLVFLFGLLGYFILIPSVFNPDAYASWVPSLLLYAVLDIYLLSRVLTLLYSRPRPQWIWTYRVMAGVWFFWLVADVTEGLLYMEAIPWVDPGHPLDALWHLPVLAMIVLARTRRWPPPAEPVVEETPILLLDRLRPRGHALTVLALALPVMHFLEILLGLNDPLTQRPQVTLLLALVLIFGGLLGRYQMVLRRMTSAVEGDRALVSNQLQMAQRMEAVGRLAAGVAHDFSNVLSVIRGRAELLLMSQQLGPEARDDVEEAVEATRRGQGLVTHLLTISRRKSGDAHTLDLSDVAQDVRDLLDRVLPEGIRLTMEVSEEPPLVVADRAQLEQVVLNLVLNARDAMQGRGSIRVTTDVVEVDDRFAATHGGEAGGVYSVLRVSDSGPGVPPEIRELVFEPFFSTKDDDLGSGLGLSVVYGIVRQARGLVRLAESPDGGALFEVYLPLAQGVAARQARVGGGRPLPGRETVLLVENHAPVRRTTARILREGGYRVIEAENAVVALAILERRNESVDVMVTDLALPDLSGHELRNRALSRKADLGVVMVSGHPEGVTPLHAPNNTQVLRKPVSPDLLTMAVRRALSDARDPAPEGRGAT